MASTSTVSLSAPAGIQKPNSIVTNVGISLNTFLIKSSSRLRFLDVFNKNKRKNEKIRTGHFCYVVYWTSITIFPRNFFENDFVAGLYDVVWSHKFYGRLIFCHFLCTYLPIIKRGIAFAWLTVHVSICINVLILFVQTKFSQIGNVIIS